MARATVFGKASIDAMHRAAGVKLMIFDIDGVLTDGGLHYGVDGEVLKRFNVLDGLGIRLLQQSGVPTALITARQSPILQKRASDLGIAHLFQGVHDKRSALAQLLAQVGLSEEHCGYLGDDLIDLPILTRVGFAAAVAGAHTEVKQRVHYLTEAGGGHGAAREICDLILHAQGNYEAALAPYLT
ncbi:HAD hydrolase family protein [Herbaspirillum sp. RTI4]|uniref:KdsC family phosphatase n=1 Tax=Herbaspirillum sp. RTI4 TaxID=3048640 RepID=UPI002AB59616|nr:HAD hydrolase family protein [Herbaspirillum sp. RTI4]MDY7577786.1 HAD hydrolase family protein [Herbaspirillum sp. RTI4]MEA9980786.1 HAD hydrolase family protein [Herbaspirillum sp. RTI4]